MAQSVTYKVDIPRNKGKSRPSLKYDYIKKRTLQTQPKASGSFKNSVHENHIIDNLDRLKNEHFRIPAATLRNVGYFRSVFEN